MCGLISSSIPLLIFSCKFLSHYKFMFMFSSRHLIFIVFGWTVRDDEEEINITKLQLSNIKGIYITLILAFLTYLLSMFSN